MHPLLFVSSTVLLAAGVATAVPNNGKCYNTDQVQAGDSLPCNPEAEVSFCCAFGDICLSNGLCEPSSNLSQYDTPYFTSTCTDYSWNSPSECPEICNNNKTNPSNGNGVMPCKDGTFCCYGLDGSGCCSTPSLPLFSLGRSPVTIQTTIEHPLTSTTPTTSASLPTSSSALPASTLPLSTSSTPSEDSPSSAATVTTPSSSARPSSSHVAVGIGIGIGVPAGLAILAGLAYLLRRRSNSSDGRDEIQDHKKELNIAPKAVHEIGAGGRPLELSEQGLVELQHPASR